MRKPIFGLLAVIAVVHWFSLPASSQVTRLKAAYSSESSWSLATWVAYDAGLFKKYGLSVDLVLIRSAATITAALIAGETPMIQLGGNGTIQAALQGADTVNVQTLVPIIPQSLVVTADIKSPEDLKGKRLGVSRFGALSDLVIRHYLRKFGLDPAKDVTIIQVGGIPELLAAMKAGAISGGSLSPPVLSAAKKAGFKELGDFESLDYKYPAVAIATTRSFIQRQRSTALNFLRAEIERHSRHSNAKEFRREHPQKIYAHQRPGYPGRRLPVCGAFHSTPAIAHHRGNPRRARRAQATRRQA